MIEHLRPGASAANARVALFDFDGTISVIRSGWMEIMIPWMVAILTDLKTGEREEDLRAIVEEFVGRLTGKQTMYQMIALAEEIEKRGGKPLDPLEYKNQYLALLNERIRDTIAELREERCSPEKYLVPGARELLEALKARGLKMYLASGTDQIYMREEARLLDVDRYFDGGVFGALDDYKSFSKKILIQGLIARSEYTGDQFLGFGDGYVEIENIKEVGGVAVGVATAEPECLNVDEWKRKRLAGVGADFIVPNFLCRDELLRTLFFLNTLAIDIGGTKFSMAIFEQDRMVRRESRTTDREGGRDWMLAQIAGIASEWRREIQPNRCGVGFGGPVDFQAQRVYRSTHVGGWSDFSLSAELTRTLRIPTIMDNDANVGALGEAFYGAGRSYSPVFYMTLSTGIGGGIFSDGKLWRGADSYAGELGHLTIRPEGPECLCGARGCFERMCSGLWLEKDYDAPAKELIRDAAFVQRYVVDLALGLKACIMLLNPARIVIGGGIGKAGDALFMPLREELRRQITDWSAARIDVVPAELADDSVLYGALALARELRAE